MNFIHSKSLKVAEIDDRRFWICGHSINSFLIMPISQKAIDFENKDLLADAYEILKTQWRNGEREREVGLHLMFLAWYGIIEPGHLTGFIETDEVKSELNQIFNEVHDYLEPQIHQDAEMLYAFGLAANMFWYMFDNASDWEKRSIEYQKRYRELIPNGIDPKIFQRSGAYGTYYAGAAEIEGGY